ncbi:DUF6283 family protein [Nocardia thailandica]|uniref:DUF6283 family protein n=1 Tax=Nocardia thailandica TaxID=257275 RepID=UPI001FE1434C|nr:DUF6283 family protein [Nocardia thailandica]
MTSNDQPNHTGQSRAPAAETTDRGDRGRMGPPAVQPCGGCPYRRDVPSGVWAAEEYAKLRAYDNDTAEQPGKLFQCHLHDSDAATARLCGGWVGCHQPHLLALRVAVFDGRISAETAQACETYRSRVPLFASGAEAA